MNDEALPVCDCHAHIFGSRDTYALAPGADYAPDNATVAEYQAVLAQLGIERCVLVQPSIYGVDNSCMLDALKTLGQSARGIAVIDHTTSHEELEEMHRLGVRGVRLNTLSSNGPSLDQLGEIEKLIAPFDWHIQILLKNTDRRTSLEAISKVRVPVVLDHFASFSPGDSPDELGALFDLAAKNDIWIKLSAPYLFGNCTREGLAYYKEFIETALTILPDRLLWGTDWPHPALKEKAITTAKLKDILIDWIPSASHRTMITSENPMNLYGF
jgi:predicted TIM-barrel fold metal-dependent hydrolase